jgi:small subunit ribosomal protein S6
MSKYELIVVLDAESKDLKKKIEALVVENGFKITDREDLGLKDLAYKIEGQEKANYIKLIVEGEGSGVKKLENAFNLEAGVLRNLTIALTEKLEKIRQQMAEVRKELQAKRKDSAKDTEKAEKSEKDEA